MKLYNWTLVLFKSECILLKNLAKTNPVTGFINSEGWKLNPKKLNQELAPFISFPKNKTSINVIVINKYIKLEYCWNNLPLKKRIIQNRAALKKTKSNCLPKGLVSDNISESET